MNFRVALQTHRRYFSPCNWCKWDMLFPSTLSFHDHIEKCHYQVSSLLPNVNNPDLAKFLQPLSRHRLVADLSIFYRLFHRHCSQEISDIIPVPLRRVRTTRSSTHSHRFLISLLTSRTRSHKSSLIPATCNLWNVLSPSSFPESYNLRSIYLEI